MSTTWNGCELPRERWVKAIERSEREAVTLYAKQIQEQTGATWGECIRVAEDRIRKDKA